MNHNQEINPQYTFNQLPLFISVKEFLETAHGDQLEARAARFTPARSSINKDTLLSMKFDEDRVLDFIYKSFLLNYEGVYYRWNLFSLFVMKSDSVDEFRKIHDKIHTVLYYLSVPEVRSSIDPFDLTLVKVLLLRQIDFFNLQLCNDKQFSLVGLLLSRYPSYIINPEQKIEIIAADDVQILYAKNQELRADLSAFRDLCTSQQREINRLTALLRQQETTILNLRQQNQQASQMNQELREQAQQANQKVTRLEENAVEHNRRVEEQQNEIQELRTNLEIVANQNLELRRDQHNRTPGLGQFAFFTNQEQDNLDAQPAVAAEKPSLNL